MTPTSVEEAAKRLADLRQHKRDLAMLESELVTYIAANVSRGQYVEGIGWVEVSRPPAKRKWDSSRLIATLAARSAEDHAVDEDGVAVPPVILAERVAVDIAVCAGVERESHSWRIGELRKRRLYPEHYYTEEGSRPTVTIKEAG